MFSRNRVVIGIALLLVLGGVVTFPLWRPFFVDDVVDEAFPDFTSDEKTAFEALPEEEQTMYIEMSETNSDMALNMARARMEDDTESDETMPDEPTVLAMGEFIEIDRIHSGEGMATIYELPDGSRVLRFENFRVTNGPDLHVILTTSADPRSRSEVGDDYVDLGQLKGNVGNQNYEIPADVDLESIQSVVIYCQPFHVVFSTATLSGLDCLGDAVGGVPVQCHVV